MDLYGIIVIAVSLGMDCFAVCIAAGIAVREGRLAVIGKMALLFGLFQLGMTLLGWAGGMYIIRWIEPYDHWIAAGLLCIVGGKMIEEGLSHPEEKILDFYSTSVLLVLALATSIDALAVGLSLSVLKIDILVPGVIIGLGSALMSGAGFWIGDRFGSVIGSRAEIIGGLFLIIIAVRILAEHLLTGQG
jgi:putative Mn2+ efflux pump MntP